MKNTLFPRSFQFFVAALNQPWEQIENNVSLIKAVNLKCRAFDMKDFLFLDRILNLEKKRLNSMLATLKDSILKKYGNPVSSAKDCRLLAEDVSTSTGRHISCTTLRRFFGLLPSKSSLSKHNLNTLAIYCGRSDYAGFGSIDRGKTEMQPEKAKQLTAHTINTVHRNSLAGLNRTIERDSLNQKLKVFLGLEKFFYPVIAPGGYGKSVALANWVDKQEKEDLVLFCEASIFNSLSLNTNGIEVDPASGENIFELFLADKNRSNSRLILVIDAIDEVSSYHDKLSDLADKLYDIAEKYSGNKRIKCIFSIREEEWKNQFMSYFEKENIRDMIEIPSSSLEIGYTNLNKLSYNEIENILEKYKQRTGNRLHFNCISGDIQALIKIPINLHIVEEIFLKTGSLENISGQEIVKEFFNIFVFESKYAEQKEDILWKIISIIDKSQGGFHIYKSDLKEALPIHLKRESYYYKAYNELLHDSILAEESIKNKYGIFTTVVSFRHTNMLYYLYALYLIKENKGIDSELILKLGHTVKDMNVAYHVISALFEIAYKNENYDAIKDFCKLPDKLLESVSVRMAIGNSFRIKNRIWEKLIKRFASSKTGRRYFFEEFVDNNYIFNNYEFRIKNYLEYETGKEAVLFGNSILFLAGFLRMDKANSRHYHDIIKGIEPDNNVYPWPIGRKLHSIIVSPYFNGELPDGILPTLITRYTDMAHSYPGHLERGLVEFELYVMVGLILMQEFELTEKVANKALTSYNLKSKNHYDFGWLKTAQNNLPFIFLNYSRFKKGHKPDREEILLCEDTLSDYPGHFDDYQFIIIMNWIMFEYYYNEGKDITARKYYLKALELSRYSEYDFFTAFILFNAPWDENDNRDSASLMIRESGFNEEMFNYTLGPSVLQYNK